MSKIQWIKLDVDMFNDEKIMLIEQLPESDAIINVWVRLLTLAGKKNAGGYIYLNKQISYTDEMLSTILRKPLPIIRLALSTFSNFGMIDIDSENRIYINNWEKHQNIEGMEKIREQNRLRKQKERERKKQLLLEEGHGMSRDSHATEKKKKRKEKEKNNNTETLSQIENSLSSYSDKQVNLLNNFFEILCNTRKTGKIADSVKLKILEELAKYPKEYVEHGIEVFVENEKYHSRKERYAIGIVRESFNNKKLDKPKKLLRYEMFDKEFDDWVNEIG